MQSYTLSTNVKDKIMRRVWISWAIRAWWPAAVLVGALTIESFFVSVPQIFRASFESTRTVDSFVAYWVSALGSTEPYVVAGVMVILASFLALLRNALKGIYRRENLL